MRTFILGGVIIMFIVTQLWRGGSAMRTIDGDGSGYYAYLTAVMVHHTTDFTKIYELEKSRRGLDYTAHYFHEKDGKMVNKYYLGTALMLLPFFLLASMYSFITGMPVDGYNILYQYAVSMGAAIYLALGLLATRKLLASFHIRKEVQMITLIALLFGTNLFYYSFLHPSHSHVYSFAAIAFFALMMRRFFVEASSRSLFLSALLLGLVMLIRPTNVLVLASLPFLTGNFNTLSLRIRQLFSKPVMLLLLFVFFVSVFFIQPLFNYIQTGEWYLWSYTKEGFRFESPALYSFLFSYRKGFFVYTPLMFLIVPALFKLFQISRYYLVTFVFYFLVVALFLSSWWNWYFGDSYGMRAMIDHFSLLSIPLALFFNQLYDIRYGKAGLFLVLASLVSLNLVQTYQYHAGILHPDSMTKEKYWHIFFKTDNAYKNIFGSLPEPFYGDLNQKTSLTFLNDMETPSKFWTSNGLVTSENAYSGGTVAGLNQSNIYSPTLVLHVKDFDSTACEKYVSVSLMFKEIEANAVGNALLVYAATDLSNQLTFYKTFKVKQIPDARINEWRNAVFGFKVPAWINRTRVIKVYVWNKEAGNFQLDDFEVNIYNFEP